MRRIVFLAAALTPSLVRGAVLEPASPPRFSASPATPAAPSAPEIERAFLAKLGDLIKQIPSLKEERSVPAYFEVKDIGYDYFAVYNWSGGIWIGRESLVEEYRTLRERGQAYPGILDVMAVHYLSTVGHEMRHILNERRLGESYAYIAEEVSGYTTESAVYEEVRGRFPDAFAYRTPLTEVSEKIRNIWKNEGLAGLRRYVKKIYPGNYRIKDVKKRVGKDLAMVLEIYNTRLAGMRDILGRCRNSAAPDACIRSMGSEHTLNSLIASIRYLKNQRNQIAGDSYLERTTRYYEEEARRARRLWKRDFGSGQ